jgi:Photosynthetic reaction centre cytochrome C subunit
LKPISLFSLVAATGLVAVAVFALSPISEAAQSAAKPPAHMFPAPTNLRVLPKDTTGAQIHEIMDGWADQIGGDCSTCHVRNPNDIGPNGRPRFNYADDSKEEKKTARVMYTMLQAINADYVGKVPNSGMPVTCGTCHRGHLSPPPFSDDDTASKPVAGEPAAAN